MWYSIGSDCFSGLHSCLSSSPWTYTNADTPLDRTANRAKTKDVLAVLEMQKYTKEDGPVHKRSCDGMTETCQVWMVDWL